MEMEMEMGVNNFFNYDFSPDEFNTVETEVAKFLLHVGLFIGKSNCLNRHLTSWGVKKIRSATRARANSSTPRSCNANGERPIVPKVGRLSPATPLSFSPSESDYRSKPSIRSFSPTESDFRSKPSKRKLLKNKTKEELDKIVSELETRRKELEQMSELYETQKTGKMKFKESKEIRLELSLSSKEGDLNLNSIRRVASNPPVVPTIVPEEEDEEEKQVPIVVHRFQPSINNHTALVGKILKKENSIYPYCQIPPLLSSGVFVGMGEELSPVGIPDLNIKLEETFEIEFPKQFDLNDRAIASAQARKRRYDIIKEKRSMKIRRR